MAPSTRARASRSPRRAAASSSSAPSPPAKRVALASKGRRRRAPLAGVQAGETSLSVGSMSGSFEEGDGSVSQSVLEEKVEMMDAAEAMKQARRIAALLHPPAAPTSELHMLRLAHAFAARAEAAPRQNSAQQQNETNVPWRELRDWPAGVEVEEEAVKDYYRRLKFIHLEVETKRLFLSDTLPDASGVEVLYTREDVAALEEAAASLKAQMKARKATVRELRSSIDSLCASLLPAATGTPSRRRSVSHSSPGAWDALVSDTDAAQALLREIGDLELDLARLRAAGTGGDGNAAHAVGKRGSTRTTVPARGTLTRDEAVQTFDEQIEEMQSLESAYAAQGLTFEARKKELTAALRSVERLNVELRVAEGYAAEARRAGLDGTRDMTVELMCQGHSSRLEVLKACLGLENLSAPDSRTLRATYATRDNDAVVLELRFAQPGGRLLDFMLSAPNGDARLDELAPPAGAARAAMQAALLANDVPLLVQTCLGCIDEL